MIFWVFQYATAIIALLSVLFSLSTHIVKSWKLNLLTIHEDIEIKDVGKSAYDCCWFFLFNFLFLLPRDVRESFRIILISVWRRQQILENTENFVIKMEHLHTSGKTEETENIEKERDLMKINDILSHPSSVSFRYCSLSDSIERRQTQNTSASELKLKNLKILWLGSEWMGSSFRYCGSFVEDVWFCLFLLRNDAFEFQCHLKFFPATPSTWSAGMSTFKVIAENCNKYTF